jgi:hypothetical protein
VPLVVAGDDTLSPCPCTPGWGLRVSGEFTGCWGLAAGAAVVLLCVPPGEGDGGPAGTAALPDSCPPDGDVELAGCSCPGCGEVCDVLGCGSCLLGGAEALPAA